ncbi:FGGY-family carbohydrate kinase [Agrobacterium rosae]|uniref:FGGY-family carbohydrate kinase n=1 Tax=Agrobacterium rosae TaxID=1972867 RepID=A0A1R3U3H0_9HYPH|nr:FGGY-family carbohydrate kinase [Agrobacterium rosae]MBN7806517.1 FGGY-family carbohydrate kinase [Agrobacterium rosae]MBN7806540.1 FGGY-family carbohydrate kinase [Agrobacterium rosae]MDX8305387.1 FGGY-family carbohydrate kinase [Agrobacterium rosae]MDX8315532.1 FGGY-family carbohydrate kinase [Agrobacterium rosae]POO49284.1 ribulokinase [Agrobacterium rosae]
MNNTANPTMSGYVIGIDVGTGSARAGLFDLDGQMLAVAKQNISLFREAGAIVEQSSAEIWDAVCYVVREVVSISGVDPAAVIGLGFDATCSLVVLGEGGRPLPVGPSEDENRDIIVWMDHRAVGQAERINALGHDVLRYVGGRISPEMETPKLLWLKENRPQTFDAAWQFFDLADFLTWKAAGDLARSTCTVTCKWTYLAHENRWDPSYFEKIGLGTLAEEKFARIGTTIVEPGTPLGQGLSKDSAKAMGLLPGTAVAAGMIDAHAGGIGTAGVDGSPESNLAYVFGTSSCTMTSTTEPVFVPGVWGPYFSAMVPGMWLNEGGQSAAGAAIDRLLSFHPATAEAQVKASSQGVPLPVLIADEAVARSVSASDVVHLALGLHVVPEFLGNRAPFADPHARAVIAGLGMDRDFESLVALYVAGLCGIGYGLRQIIEVQAEAGANVERVVISGGAGQHDLVRQVLADACGKSVVATVSEEPVLLGSAILGAVASGAFSDARSAMTSLCRVAKIYTPAGGDLAAIHAKRYAAFSSFQDLGRSFRES